MEPSDYLVPVKPTQNRGGDDDEGLASVIGYLSGDIYLDLTATYSVQLLIYI